ncbi:hypothetical protein TRFO_02921 [Tritrichomonas foetus]|uniref:Kelch motif family protein n=1 Tax=Tritrichomonas foetus TaxID=1144522 RepID=A0A1J4KWF6_9EUKA|nr:hypothetical protein TRFO_02921 [Tritrichomonas foetus]|eukprot:OHT15571.1 hypothetical protein TRFO_02921 [Tritrichomonas foetus]
MFYVWGGFNGQLPTELHILDPQTKIWEMIPQDVIGRKSIPYVVVDDKILSYGGNKSGGMLIVDMPQKKVYVRITTGASPPSRVLDPGMTVYGKYLFYYGGRDTTTNHTFMYVCDTERYWWFIMHVLPDDETVSMSDGIVCKIGLFMLPRLHSFSFLCEQRKRELYVFLGAPEKDQVPISVVQIYEPISILNMRDDMLCAFEGDTGLKVSAFL